MDKGGDWQRRYSTVALKQLVAAGALTQLVGGLVAGLAWDNTLGVFVGLAVAVAGSMLMLVGVIGFGVLLGLRARAVEEL